MKQKVEELLLVVKTLEEMYVFNDSATEREIDYAVQHLRKAVDALRRLNAIIAAQASHGTVK